MKKVIFGISALMALAVPYTVFADVSGSVTLSCDKQSININETATCTMKVKVNSGELSSIMTKITNSSQIEVTGINVVSNYGGTGGNDGTDSIVMIAGMDNLTAGTYDIVKINVKGKTAGDGSLSLTKLKISDDISPEVSLSNVSTTITVVDPTQNPPSGGGTTTPDDDNNDPNPPGGGGTTTPDDDNNDPNPPGGGGTTTPDDDNNDPNPPSGGGTTTPDDDDDNPNPPGGGGTTTPDDDDDNSNLPGGGGTTTPDGDDDNSNTPSNPEDESDDNVVTDNGNNSDQINNDNNVTDNNTNEEEKQPDTGSFINLLAIIGLPLGALACFGIKKFDKFNKI